MVKIWIGRRESDILTSNTYYFDYSITYYGSNDKIRNFTYSTETRTSAKYDKAFYEFVVNCIDDIHSKVDGVELYFYNALLGRKLEQMRPHFKSFFKNCNNYNLLDWLNNKSYTRFWLANTVDVPPFTVLSNSECTYQNLKQKFSDYSEYIIQKNNSSGGNGTYHMTSDNENDIRKLLSPTEPYLVSPYLSNTISACCHVIVGKDSDIIFPIGYQYISLDTNTMNYMGTTYKSCKNTDYSHIYKFINNISRRLSKNGYRGICGYDFLIMDKKTLLIEINPRYMASSYLINYVLEQNQLPSLFYLNDLAFNENSRLADFQCPISNLEIPYETHTVYYTKDMNTNLPADYIICLSDGFEKAKEYEEHAYLYRYITK